MGSTNTHAIRLARQNADKNGTVIHAFWQTAGRGQRESVWLTDPYQNLTFSLIYHPKDLLITDQNILAKVVALSVFDFLKDYNCSNIEIKWPNDLLVNRKKIAGILIENVIEGKLILKSVIGIGVNLNQNAFPDDISHATSVYLETSKSLSVQNSRDFLLEKIAFWINKFENDAIEEINDAYFKRLYGTKKWIQVEVEGVNLKAVLKSINQHGLVNLMFENGTEKLFGLIGAILSTLMFTE